jgi:subtilase family serine protease
LFKTKITPKNITQFLNSLDLPEIIKVINLDIDSYDYFILEQLLKNFKFQILILEINPMFPSTIDFTVTFKEDHSYDSNMFQGSSISMTYNLLAKNDYSVVHIDRGFALAVNNKFLNNKVKPITFNEIDDILDKSIINNDPKRWERYKEYRELDIDEAILKIKELFKNYDNYYLEKNYRNS